MPGVLKQYVGNVWTPIITGAEGATGPAGGVESIVAGTGISVDQATGNVTISATGGGASTGNIVFDGYTIESDVADPFDTATRPLPAQIQIGTGYPGDSWTPDDWMGFSQHAAVNIVHHADINEDTNGGRRTYGLNNTLYATNLGNITTNNTRVVSLTNSLQLTGNDYGQASLSRLAAFRNNIVVGDGETDTDVTFGLASYEGISIAGRTDGGTNTLDSGAVHVVSLNEEYVAFDGSPETQINHFAGIGFNIGVQQNTKDNWSTLACLHNQASDNIRGNLNYGGPSDTNYYFLRNDNPNSQEQLGALRRYHERYRQRTYSAGAIILSPLRAMVQEVDVTSDITSVTLQDFVGSTNNMTTSQTISVLFKQDATGRSITFPTGAVYYYANGVNTIAATPNAHTWVMITGQSRDADNPGETTVDYYITISPTYETV